MFPSHRLFKKQALIVLSLTVIFIGGNGFSWLRAQKECQAIGEQIRTAPRSNNSHWTTYHKRRSQWIGTLDMSRLEENYYGDFHDLQIQLKNMCDMRRGSLKDNRNCVEFTRQIYISKDRGKTLSEVERNNILSCQRCKGNGCKYFDCEYQVDKIFCSKTTLNKTFSEVNTYISVTISQESNFKLTTITTFSDEQKKTKMNAKTTVALHSKFHTSPEIRTDGMSYKSLYSRLFQTSIAKHKFSTTFMNQQKRTKLNEDITTSMKGCKTHTVFTVDSTSDVKVAVKDESESMTAFIQIGAAVLSLVISASLIFIVVRVIRRKQNEQEKRSVATHKNLIRQNIVEESISGSQDAAMKSRTDEHSFEVCTYELADITYLEEERQHTGGEESHYDHLRDTVPTKLMGEDIYNHLQTESEFNYSTFTGRVEHQETVDDTYSHADFHNDRQNLPSVPLP